ncbi:LacI family transcriptional regulator [Polaribacter reichenbachii]|uniref:LacI family transcriptional regulator n=1 Tax=Polaribacter reichenbachii TaxID=996801 RepID=A0A1B8TNR2_9FLAO|nr:LacI family DNA-binding transcriptional regulator [Polaribacter reichenbachii]APZ46656.1 LacI family transcriptional regulator [Polaribacter reichenbachii]AUC17299.1 LacI family transcriptional regulator [Polaribacter reichenbachii]OBY61253.1 LacI family transcriptional regulator [Polaribacter reichenbachii]
MINKKDVTIYDIASKLNLSSSTVSRALRNSPSISKKTISKIKKTADEMGYRPNTLAASLRGNKSNSIGILVPTVKQPFLSSLISGIEVIAQKAGYNVIIAQSHDSYEDEVALTKALYGSRVSGIICSLAMHTKKTAHFQKFIDKKIPLVFVDRIPKDNIASRVMIDNYAAGRKATMHLISQGCNRIAYLAAGSDYSIFNERKKGYLNALKEANLPIEEDLIVKLDDVTYEDAIKATNKLLDLKNPPDAIFAPADILGVGVIKSAKIRGIKIPEELAIIGFNDDPIASIVDPELSTVYHPSVKMGEISASKILEYLKKPKSEDFMDISLLNTDVIVRASSKRK